MSHRVLLVVACLLAFALAAYGSFVPFRPSHASFSAALTQFEALRLQDPRTASKTDLVANVLLFIPIGLTLSGALARRSGALSWLMMFVVTMAALVGSAAIEFGQTFVAGRTPSKNDILAQTFGAAIGMSGWVACRSTFVDWLRPVATPVTPLERLRRLLILYATAWALVHVLPLDFTLRPVELAEKYRAGRIVLRPFANRSTIDVVVTAATTALSAVPIGALTAFMVAERRTRFSRGTLLASAAIAALELIQVLVMSRTANLIDVVWGTLGAALGASLAASWRPGVQGSAIEAARSSTGREWLRLLLVVWVGIVIVRHWTPFDFRLTRTMYDARAVAFWNLPFRNYYEGQYLQSLHEALTKTLLGAPIGLLCGLMWAPRNRGPRRIAQVLALLGLSLAYFTIIEIGQVFLPSRVPDDTDILLGTVGSMVGLVAIRLVEAAMPSSVRLEASVLERGSSRRAQPP